METERPAAAGAWRHTYRWDLDKTYLDSRFETLSGMVRLGLERPEEKVNVPGSAELLRELARDRPDSGPARIAFVSGSPSQLRAVLEDKLRIDGVRWDEFHLKPQWDNLRRGRFRAVREQVGYKLPLLLESRARAAAPETLFGDDAEADVLIYSLYADLIAGRAGEADLAAVLKAAGAYPDVVERTQRALAAVPRADAVETIFIHLDRGTPPGHFRPYGARVVPVWNYFQAALVLFARHHVDAGAVVAITRALLSARAFGAEELANLFQDIVRRGHLPASAMQRLALAVQDLPDVLAERGVIWMCVQRFSDLAESRHYTPPAPPSAPNWVALLELCRRSPATPGGPSR